MCGRFTLKTAVIDWLMSLFPQYQDRLESLARNLTQAYPLLARPRYNISPTQPIWVVTQFKNFFSPPPMETLPGDGPIRSMRWGLVPSWADSTNVAYSMINARSETLHEKPSFKNLIRGHRCIIIADGYYEWLKPSESQASQESQSAKSPKQPYWIHRPGDQPFAMAGLWTENKRVNRDEVLQSATVITTEANDDTRHVHDRMPVILQDAPAVQQWLQWDEEMDEILPLLAPSRTGYFITRAVSTQVNSPRHEGSQLIEPVDDQPT
jgi:putative SOS response-associated peptidase YedK